MSKTVSSRPPLMSPQYFPASSGIDYSEFHSNMKGTSLLMKLNMENGYLGLTK